MQKLKRVAAASACGLLLAVTASYAQVAPPAGAVDQSSAAPSPQLQALLDNGARKACPRTGVVAANATGKWLGSSGSASLIRYEQIALNEGDALESRPLGSVFVAPCAGLYVFNVSFVKDAYYDHRTCIGLPAGAKGTTDDVQVYLAHNLTMVPGMAWSGGGDGVRGTGAFSAIVKLAQGDVISTWVRSDGDVARCLASIVFTGHRIDA